MIIIYFSKMVEVLDRLRFLLHTGEFIISNQYWADSHWHSLSYTIFIPANEASIPENFIFLLLFTPQISEGIDDNTKNEVQNYNDNNEEEQ